MSLANCLIKSGKTFTAQERQEILAESRTAPLSGTAEDQVLTVNKRLDIARAELVDVEKTIDTASLTQQWNDLAGDEARYTAPEIVAMGKAAGASAKDIRDAIAEMRAAKADAPRPNLDLAGQSEAEIRVDEAKKAKAEADKLKADAAAELARKQELDKADLRARAQATVDDFQLGGDALSQVSGQQPIFSRTETASLWRSVLTDAIGKAPFKETPAAQWKAWLQSNAAKLGVKKDEVEWSGINEWLDLQTGKVTREQVQAYLDANGVKVTETELGAEDALVKPRLTPQERSRLDELQNGFATWDDESDNAVGARALTPQERAEKQSYLDREDAVLHAESRNSKTRSKYGQYQLPGGENYRELLLTLPASNQMPAGYSVKQVGDMWHVTNPNGKLQGVGMTQEGAVERAIEIARSENNSGEFKSSHWDQPNILAHIRFNERVDADGKRVLFIEEIQSDWGQAGKKTGFADSTTLNDGFTISEMENGRWRVEQQGRAFPILTNDTREGALHTAVSMGYATRGAVPNAPFVGKTEAWVSLALKRMIRYAVDNGFDRVAMVNGEQSAQRYSLSESVEKITVTDAEPTYRAIRINTKAGGQIGLIVHNDGIVKDGHRSQQFYGKPLSDVVGKDMADRLMSAQSKTEFSGDGLNVGGTGMKAFYDSIVPNVANDVLKKLGGGKVGTVEISQQTGEDDSFEVVLPNGKVVATRPTRKQADATAASFDGATVRALSFGSPQPGFDITDKMKEQAAQGMPLFRRDPAQSKPEPTQVAQAVIDAVSGNISGVKLQVFATPQAAEAYFGVAIPDDARGLFFRGEVGLIATNITSKREAEFVLWHELLHAGLTQLAPRAGQMYRQLMNDLAARNGNIAKAASQWRSDYGPETVARYMSTGDTRANATARMNLLSIEEALADLSGANVNLNGWSGFISKLQAILRTLGFNDLANWVEGKSNAEAMQLIAKTRDAITSDGAQYLAQVPAFARDGAASRKEVAPDTITVDNVERSRNNSNGQPIAATEEMFPEDFAGKRTKVDTGILASSKGDTIKGGNVNADGKVVTFTKQGLSKFWNWFGTSVAVDAKNRPIVMYHSTNGDISTFESGRKSTNNYGLLGDVETSRSAIFITSERDFSQEYLRDGSGKNVMPVYVSLQNPIDLSDGLSESDEAALSEHGIDARYVHNIQNHWELFDNDDENKNKFVDALKSLGYDGAVFYETGQDGKSHKTYAVFSPNQIKSATGNNGQFSPDNADIRFSRTVTTGDVNRTRTPEQLAAFQNLGRTTQEPTIKERAQALWKDAGKKLAQGIVDQFAPVKDLSKEAYGLLRLSKGASGAFEVLLRGGKLKLTDGVYDLDGKNDGGVVEQLLIPLQGEHHDFLWWIAANRAERLIGEGKENLFTPADITAMKSLSDGNTAFDYTLKTGPNAGTVTRNRLQVYSDSQRVFNAYNKNVLDLAEQSGMIDGASRKTWEHEFYVPFYRVADEGVRGINVKSGVVRQQAFKELKGGKNTLNADLLDNTLMNWAHLLDASAKNRAAKATIDAAEQMGVAATGDQATLEQMAASTKNKGGVVWFMDGGQKRYSLMDNTGDGPYILAAINALEYAGMRGPIMDAMGTMKHALTVGVTASPFFKVRNLIRDSVQAIGTSGLSYNPAANLAQGWKLTDPKSDAYFRLLAGGGTIQFGSMVEGSEAKRIQHLVESGVDDSTILNDGNKLKAFYSKFVEPSINAYNELGNRGEAINRAALYDQLTKQGMSHAEASLQARDLMDFSMQGNFATIRFLTQVVPFMNARIQGLSKLGRSAMDDPKKFGVVLGAVGVISIGLLAAYGDDEDWKKREEWDRNNFWWFKIGGSAFRIPKPFEIGAIATLAERGFELAFDKEMTGERFRKQVVTLLGDNLSMNPTPQAIKPILEVYANKGFNDRPIESMGMEHLKSEYRFTERTSMTARALSTAANSATDLIGLNAPSPVQIDHMLRGYFGWLGSFVVGAGDVLARPATNQATRAAPDLWKEATGSMVSDLRDAPSRYVSQMYTQAKELEEAYGTYHALQKQGKIEEARDFAADNRDKLNKYQSVEHVKRAEAKFNERARLIERSNLDPEVKRERLREIADQKNRLAQTLI